MQNNPRCQKCRKTNVAQGCYGVWLAVDVVPNNLKRRTWKFTRNEFNDVVYTTLVVFFCKEERNMVSTVVAIN